MNIAFAGFRHGHILSLYNEVLSNDQVNLIGCFEADGVVRKEVEASHRVNFNYTAYEEILTDASVDTVAIGDYYGIRGKLVIDALKHGKHVICDKPICTDLAELDEIKKLAKETGLKVCCMLDLRYAAQVDQARKLIRSGALGEVHIASFTGQHCLNYGVRPSWYFEEGKHGGTINDIAIHGIDLLRYLTGKNLSRINCAKTWNAFADQEPNFPDSAQFMIEMESVSVMADVSYSAPKCSVTLPTYWNFCIWGSKGLMKFNLTDSAIHLYREAEEVIPCEESGATCLTDFLEEINGKPKMMETFESLESQRQVLMIQKAADDAR